VNAVGGVSYILCDGVDIFKVYWMGIFICVPLYAYHTIILTYYVNAYVPVEFTCVHSS